MDRDIPVDYIGISWIIALLLPLPLLKTNKWLNPFIFYVWILGVYKTQNPNHRLDFPINVLLSAENQCMYFMVFITILVILYRIKLDSSLIYKTLAWLGIINIFITTALMPLDEPFISGIVFNKSMNAILNLTLAPIIFFVYPHSVPVVGLFLLVTVLGSNSTSAVVAMGVTLVWAYRAHLWVLATTAFAVLLTALLNYKKFFQYQDRLEGYQFFFKSFTKSDWVIGRGPGSFFPFSVHEQVKRGFQISADLQHGNGLFVWLHSDPLQAVYEYGLIGFILLVPVIYWVFRYSKTPEKYSFIALAVGCLVYYPLHFPTHLVVTFLLLKIVANNYKHI